MKKFCLGIMCLLLHGLAACGKIDVVPVTSEVELALQLDYAAKANLPGGKTRCIIRAYPIEGGKQAKKHSAEMLLMQDMTEGYDFETTWKLPMGDYEIMVWSDLMEEDATIPFHNADDFGAITLQGRHTGSNDWRNAFRGMATVSLREEDERCTLKMESPLAKFELVAEDLAEFMAKETQRRKGQSPVVGLKDYRVVFQYVGYMPNAFSIYTDRPVDSSTGVTFTSSLKELNPTEASLGFDYVFVNDKESAVTVRVAIYDAEGTCLSTSRSIKVPLKRNQHTVLRGTYLTQEASDGISIDNNYEGNFNLVIP